MRYWVLRAKWWLRTQLNPLRRFIGYHVITRTEWDALHADERLQLARAGYQLVD